ncbi:MULTISPECIES: hypothetical protein [Streptomyces]|uniref:hypothetical protein n=1 Tax=Streptomyces TaxID=1883 RepID=UPI0015C47DB0|nr:MULTISPECIES: hypothetical protein [Streptomyces]MBK0377174.1 hypothetical protein [Streptomyces sp. RB110-1]MBK0386454.1 hypothetical protein [Streptomyces sp. RB110-2]MCF3170888.1 hypothetical protein [Streptomyces violaceoruber]QLG34653.1 hypothetical protein HXS80_25600 [Streptomyces sp. CB04723]
MFHTDFVSMYPWLANELEETHGGQPGVVNEDGTEPGPLSIPSHSGAGSIGTLTEWWAYDGSLGRAATHLRGSCSCGWRGETLYPVDWDEAHEEPPYAYDTSGPERDWKQHTEEVRSALVPLPADLVALLDQVNEQVARLSDGEPLLALRAGNILLNGTQLSLQNAAWTVERDGTSMSAVGAAIGCTSDQAARRLRSYR